MKVQATVDLPSTKKVDEQIRALEKNISKLKVSGKFDDTALKNLTNQLNTLKATVATANFSPVALKELTSQVENALKNINISGVNIGNINNGAKQTGQQIGSQISQGISQGISSASRSTEKVLRDFSELNDAKRKFVDGHDLISKDDIADAERLYDTVRKAFSEFGQVTVSKGSMNDGSLENMRVKIEQVNGEMKITRDFMLYFNESKNGFRLVDDDTIRTTEKMIQHLNEEKNIVNATNEEANAIKAKLAEQEKYYKNIKNEVNNLYSLKTKLLSADELQTAELEKQIKQTKERISYNNKQIDKKDLRDNSLDRQINDLEVAKQKQLNLASAKSQDTINTKELAQAERETTAALKERQSIEAQVNKIQLSMDNGHGASEYQNRINAVTASLEKYGVETQEAKNITASLQSTFDSMKGMSGQELVTQADKLEQEFKAVKVSVDQAKLSYDKLMQPASKEKISSTLLKVQKLLDNNTKVTENVKNEWQGYVNRLSSGSDIAVKEINDINIRLKQTESNMRRMGKLGFSWIDKLKQAWEKFGGWGFATGTMMTLYNQIRRIPQEVYEIDTAMTNLYKVTDETSSKYNQFLESSSKSAHDLGRSISSLVEQTANWAKLGFSLDEAEQLAKISSIYANVGEVDNDTAVSDMVTAMKAFNIEASDSITIVDKLNKLGNEYATSAAALGDGLSRSASAMSTSGTDINKTLAMLTGGTEITQNASEFGNFLKVGSMRIRGMKGELEMLGEEVDETVDSISKVQTQILNRTGGKVNIFDDMGNFRDYYDIMEDISKVYNDLNDPDKADLTEILFGKQRGNQGAALIQAFQSGQIQKALEATLNAEGSAMQEQERWMESLEAKIEQFEATFQSLSSTVLDSGLLKWFVDFGTGAVKVLDTVVDKLGSLGTIGLGAGLFAGVKNTGKCRISVRIS